MNIDDAIHTRRTNKVYDRRPVPAETLDELFELARWAPNHHLTDPWRFRVLGPDVAGPAEGRRGRGRRQARPGADAGLRQPGDRRRPVQNEEDLCAVACAAYIVLLAAHARGHRVLLADARRAAQPEGRAALGLGDDERAVGLLHLGWSDREWLPPERAPVADVVTYLD